MKTKTGNSYFIRNVVSVDVDGLRGVNHYTVKAMHDVEYTDGETTWCEIEYKTLDDFDYTWGEIERDGGIAQVNRDFEECYGVGCMRR